MLESSNTIQGASSVPCGTMEMMAREGWILMAVAVKEKEHRN